VFQRLRRLTSPLFREELRFFVLRAAGKIIMPAYRFSWPSLAWWKDAEFNAFLDLFDERKGQNTDRRWMLFQLAIMSNEVPGDTAECGAYRGAGSHLICKATQRGDVPRMHFIFDSFHGLSAPSLHDSSYWRTGDLHCSLEEFKRPSARVSIYPGWIPDRFNEVAHRHFSFVHVDVDLYQPTADSVAFFYPLMNPGGIMVFDDYGFTTCPGARKAIDDFMADKPEKVIQLSCGSAFLVKAAIY
jgi:O-methyltransferase